MGIDNKNGDDDVDIIGHDSSPSSKKARRTHAFHRTEADDADRDGRNNSLGTFFKSPLVELRPSTVCSGVGVFATTHLPRGSYVTAYAGRCRAKEKEKNKVDSDASEGSGKFDYIYECLNGLTIDGAVPEAKRSYWMRHGVAQLANDALFPDLLQKGLSNNCRFMEVLFQKSPSAHEKVNASSRAPSDPAFSPPAAAPPPAENTSIVDVNKEAVGSLDDRNHQEQEPDDIRNEEDKMGRDIDDRIPNSSRYSRRVYLVTTRDVQEGEELLASYGLCYWLAKLDEHLKGTFQMSDVMFEWLSCHACILTTLRDRFQGTDRCSMLEYYGVGSDSVASYTMEVLPSEKLEGSKSKDVRPTTSGLDTYVEREVDVGTITCTEDVGGSVIAASGTGTQLPVCTLVAEEEEEEEEEEESSSSSEYRARAEKRRRRGGCLCSSTRTQREWKIGLIYDPPSAVDPWWAESNNRHYVTLVTDAPWLAMRVHCSDCGANVRTQVASSGNV